MGKKEQAKPNKRSSVLKKVLAAILVAAFFAILVFFAVFLNNSPFCEVNGWCFARILQDRAAAGTEIPVTRPSDAFMSEFAAGVREITGVKGAANTEGSNAIVVDYVGDLSLQKVWDKAMRISVLDQVPVLSVTRSEGRAFVLANLVASDTDFGYRGGDVRYSGGDEDVVVLVPRSNLRGGDMLARVKPCPACVKE